MIFSEIEQNIQTVEIQGFSPIEIDQIICEEIDNLTAENNMIWTSPDHDRREYVHSFFQYPAMMVPIVQKKLIEIIVNSKPCIENVLDAFMGSGTSLVACMENGLNCYGQDVNPLAVLVTKTRTGPFYFSAIAKKKEKLFEAIDTDKSTQIAVTFKGIDKWFKASVQQELSRIVRAIKVENNLSIRRFYWVLLAETIRLTSNDRTSTFKLHARPLDEIENRSLSPIEMFKKHYGKCLDDLKEYATLLKRSDNLSKGSYTGDCVLNLLDSKSKIYTPHNQDGFFDLHVTSPPYGDNKTTVTYGQYSYLPLQWIDMNDIDPKALKTFLSTTSEIDSLGLGGKLKKVTPAQLEVLFNASPTLMKIYNQIHLFDKDKSKKVITFFFDIHQSIVNIHNAIKQNGYQIWTIGNRTVAGIEIPNNLIMSELIRYQGSILVKTISREILNRRMAKRNKTGLLMTFEDILIFRKIG